MAIYTAYFVVYFCFINHSTIIKKITMKSIVTASLFLMLISICTLSCKKNKATVYPEESFGDDFLTQTGLQKSPRTFTVSNNYAELGLEFKPTSKGKITSLLIKLPGTNSNLRVTIWDKVTQIPIRTEYVNVATANTLIDFDINDLELVKNKEYAITMKSSYYYERWQRIDPIATGPVPFPIFCSNICLLRHKLEFFSNSSLQKYPDKIENYNLGGDCYFKFQQID
jgi:hypothetical protein